MKKKETSNSLKGAALYREAVRQTFFRYEADPNVDPDKYFRTFLENKYTLVKNDLVQHLGEKVSDYYVNSDRLGVFVSAVGLFTYGRLDVLYDILDNVPPPNVPLYRLLGVLRSLLPLPATLSIRTDLDGIKEWVVEHESYLVWNAEICKYTLVF